MLVEVAAITISVAYQLDVMITVTVVMTHGLTIAVGTVINVIYVLCRLDIMIVAIAVVMHANRNSRDRHRRNRRDPSTRRNDNGRDRRSGQDGCRCNRPDNVKLARCAHVVTRNSWVSMKI